MDLNPMVFLHKDIWLQPLHSCWASGLDQTASNPRMPMLAIRTHQDLRQLSPLFLLDVFWEVLCDDTWPSHVNWLVEINYFKSLKFGLQHKCTGSIYWVSPQKVFIYSLQFYILEVFHYSQTCLKAVQTHLHSSWSPH